MVQKCTKGLLVTFTNSHVVHYIYILIIIDIVHFKECLLGEGVTSGTRNKGTDRAVVIIIKVCHKMTQKKSLSLDEMVSPD